MAPASHYAVITVGNHLVENLAETTALREAGYRVLQAVDNGETFRMADQEGPALLLLPDDDKDRFRIMADNAPALL